jgi:C4-dicarboxylate transporter, DctM subunit
MDVTGWIAVLIVLLFFAGVEVITVLGIGAVLLTLATDQFPLMNISLTMFDSLNLFPLIALPLFVVTGDLIAAGGIAHQIMRFSRSLVGWMHGGLGLTAIVASGIFAAISGSNAATVATVGRVVLPSMEEEGYPKAFAAGTVAAGGVVGIIIPPSIAFVLYGVTIGVSVSDLFIAGILPGILMVVMMCVLCWFLCKRRGYGQRFPFTWRELGETAYGTKYALGAVAIILVGIYAGIFTPTEAGAVAAVYCLFVGMFITRRIELKLLPAILARSASICGLVAPIVAIALVFSQNIAVLRIPAATLDFFMAFSDSDFIRLMAVLLLLLIAGCIMEAAPNILLLSPILVPIGQQLGIDPIHFGVVIVSTLAVGFITPPIGLNLFVASAMSGAPFSRIARVSFVYVMVLIVALLIITFVPALSLMFLK